MRSSCRRGMSWRWRRESRRPGLSWWVTAMLEASFQTFFKFEEELLKPKSLSWLTFNLNHIFLFRRTRTSRWCDFGYSCSLSKVGLHSSHSCVISKLYIWSKLFAVSFMCTLFNWFFNFRMVLCVGEQKRLTSLPNLIDNVILYLSISCDWYFYCLFTWIKI